MAQPVGPGGRVCRRSDAAGEPGSPSWAIAATAKLVDARYVHRHRFLSALDAVHKVEPEIDAVSTMAFALAIGIYMLDSAGEFALAESCLQRLHDIVEPVAGHNPWRAPG